jgi:hypothetical protein
MRRGAGGLEGEGSGVRRDRAGLGEVSRDILREACVRMGLRVGPSCGSKRAATIVVAISCVADEKPSGFRDLNIVAVMNCLPHTACGRRSNGRQSQRAEVGHERCEQQESGDQPGHGSCENQPLWQE